MIRAASALALLLAGAAPASADPAAATVVVEGRASVAVAPDVALVSLGVVTNRAKAADALADNSRATGALLAEIKAAGVNDNDVSTASVSLTPTYRAGDGQLTGYRADNHLEIRVTPVAETGALLSRLADSGANMIDGVTFMVSPDAKREDDLRAAAMKDARHKAGVYVEALGLRLGRALTIVPNTELGNGFRVKAAFGSAAAGVVPLAAGTRDETAEVSVTFEVLE